MADAQTTGSTVEKSEEGFLHYIAREGRMALRWIIVLSVIAIVICMVTLWFLAVIPALVLFVSFVLLILTNEVEKRSDKIAHEELERSEIAGESDVMENHAEDDQLAPVNQALVKRESKTGLIILGSVLVVATVIAAVFLDKKVMAIGAFVVFAYILLIAAPLWLGWIEDDIEDETQRLENQNENVSESTSS